MLDIETILRAMVSRRFKELRRCTPAELISNGQKTAINRIEQEKNPKSGNFVTDTLLDDYSTYFSLEKKRLIFGDDSEIEDILCAIFIQIFYEIVPRKCSFSISSIAIPIQTRIKYLILPLCVDTYTANNMLVIESFRKLFFIFGDYSRWYKIRQDEKDSDQHIDWRSMFEIVWKLIKKRVVKSFQVDVVDSLFDGKNDFHFNRINHRFELWYKKQFVQIIVPEILERLKSESVFKMGFQTNCLIDDFYEKDLPLSYLQDIPLEKYELPSTYFPTENMSEEEVDKFREGYEFIFDLKTAARTRDEVRALNRMNFFREEISIPCVDETRRVNIMTFLDEIIDSPESLDCNHKLNESAQKIPGLLTVNSQVYKILHYKDNERILKEIDMLVSRQNLFLRLMKWEELGSFI